MSYYKLIRENEIVDAILDATANWLVENPRTHSFYTGPEAEAKGVLSTDGQTVWHIEGKLPFADYPNFQSVTLEEISEEEYRALRLELDAGAILVEPESGAGPDSAEEAAGDLATTKVQKLEAQISALMEANNVLMECLLEMSEIVYG